MKELEKERGQTLEKEKVERLLSNFSTITVEKRLQNSANPDPNFGLFQPLSAVDFWPQKRSQQQ